MERVLKFLAKIITPYPNQLDQYKARLLAGISLTLLITVSAAILIQLVRRLFGIVEVIAFSEIIVLFVVFYLSRTNRFSAGANLLIAASFPGVLATIVFYWNPTHLTLILIPILLASFFWPFERTVILTIGVLALALFIIITRVDSVDQMVFLSIYLMIMSALVIVAAGLRQYFEKMANKQLQVLNENESRYRAAIHGSLDSFYLLDSVRDANGKIIDFRFVEVNQVTEKTHRL